MNLYDTLKPVAGGVLWTLLRLHVEGREHVPPQGPFIVACNHVFDVDIICLAYALYPLHVHYMAKEELFRGKLLGGLIRGLHAYPVNRHHPGPGFVKHTLQILKAGGVVGIFPEGTRHQAGELGPLKTGAVRIAMRAKVPILPAWYDGPAGWRELVGRPPALIRFGPLLHLDEAAGARVADALVDQMVGELSEAMSSLANPLPAV